MSLLMLYCSGANSQRILQVVKLPKGNWSTMNLGLLGGLGTHSLAGNPALSITWQLQSTTQNQISP